MTLEERWDNEDFPIITPPKEESGENKETNEDEKHPKK